MKEYCIWGGRQREWGKQRARSTCFSFVKLFPTILASDMVVFRFLGLFMPRLQRMSSAVSPRNNRSERVNTYICLDELTALFSYSAHKAKDIHPLFHVHHVDHAVNDNERPSPPHPGTVEKKKAQGLFCNKQPSAVMEENVSNKKPLELCVYIVKRQL